MKNNIIHISGKTEALKGERLPDSVYVYDELEEALRGVSKEKIHDFFESCKPKISLNKNIGNVIIFGTKGETI